MDVRIRENKSVALSRSRNPSPLRPGFWTAQQSRPPCSGVTENTRIVCCEMRKDVPFCTPMGCVVAQHQSVHIAVCGQLAQEGTVVTGESDGPDFPLLFQFQQVFLNP